MAALRTTKTLIRRLFWIVVMVVPPVALLWLMTGDFTRNESFELRGQVVDADGVPIPNVAVNARLVVDTTNLPIPIPWSGSSKSEALRTATDAQGRFVLKGRGISLLIGFMKRGFAMDGKGPHYILDNEHPNSEVGKPAVFVMKKEN